MDNKISKNEFLKKMKNARENINKFQNLPLGAYMCLLKEVLYKPSKAGKEMVTFVYRVLEGDYRKREHRNFYMIGSDSDVPFNMLVQDIANLGYPSDEISSFEAMLALFEQIGADKLTVNIRISENPDPQYANRPRTRIEEVVDMPAPESQEPSPEDTTTEPEIEDAETVEDVVEEEPTKEEEVVEDVIEDDVVEDDEEEIDIGTKVAFEFKKGEMEGTIESASEDGTTVVIKCSDDKKRRVKCEKILKVVK